MNKRILYTNEDGGVSIIAPFYPDMSGFPQEDIDPINGLILEQAELDVPRVAIIEVDTPQGVISIGDYVPKHYADEGNSTQLDYEIVDIVEVPSDRTFRSAWEHDITTAPEKIKANMTKAKVIAHNMRRGQREEVFAPNLAILNKVSMGIPLAPDENATTAAEANAAYKASVDDVMQTAIDAANSEDDLKAALDA